METQQYQDLANRLVGLRYDAPEAMAILNEADWNQIYPEASGQGEFTGGLVGYDEPNYANLADVAMVPFSELTGEQIAEAEESGYVELD